MEAQSASMRDPAPRWITYSRAYMIRAIYGDASMPAPIRVRTRIAANGLKRTVEMKGSARHGYERYFRADGTLYHEIPYVDDKQHGTEMMWYANGQLRRRLTHVNGMHGDGITLYPNGDVAQTWEVTEDGTRIHADYYRNGQLLYREVSNRADSWSEILMWNRRGELIEGYDDIDDEEEDLAWDHVAEPDDEDEAALDDSELDDDSDDDEPEADDAPMDVGD
jgi:hypothetical protein